MMRWRRCIGECAIEISEASKIQDEVVAYMNGTDVINLGFSEGPVVGKVLACARVSGYGDRDVKIVLSAVRKRPKSFLADPYFAELAQFLLKDQLEAEEDERLFAETTRKGYRTWGPDGIEEQAKQQMDLAMELPIAVAGALMPDAHLGYGLPIGGVVGCKHAVVPNAVGVDIACRMKLSVFDLTPKHLTTNRPRLRDALTNETRFGIGAKWTREQRRQHEVMDDPTWAAIKFMRNLKDKAHEQLGTSGSGNHFVEFGYLTINQAFDGIEPGEYLALLSHSGSRGPGAMTAKHYKDRAVAALRKKFEKFKNLAWLNLDSEDGQEYWEAMNLMGRFASANHDLIHRHVAGAIGAQIVGGVENHHNFAWKETHADQETRSPVDMIVHRKGATPAGPGVLGVIPGSMGSPCFVVLGKGNNESLASASHGAGRRMSRTAAKEKFVWSVEKQKLEKQGVEVMSCGVDEVPGVYKDIKKIMAEQNDLVEAIAEFNPKLVRMSDGGKAED